MIAVEIHDLTAQSVLAFDLIDLLTLCESATRASTWRVEHVEAYGWLASELHRLADERNLVSGAELLRLAAGIDQTIDGEFEAYQSSCEKPWLVIRAIDSALFIVVTSNDDLIAKVRSRFADVRDNPRWNDLA